MPHRRARAALLLLAAAATLAVGERLRAGEGTTPLGVSLTILAGCAVSIDRGPPVTVACTGEVPFAVGVLGAAGTAGTGGAASETEISLAPGSDADSVNVVVIY